MTDLQKAAQDVVDEFITGNYELILARKINALRTALAEPHECEWTYDGYSFWGMQCNGLSNRAENPQINMIHCYGCGKRIRFIEGKNNGS